MSAALNWAAVPRWSPRAPTDTDTLALDLTANLTARADTLVAAISVSISRRDGAAMGALDMVAGAPSVSGALVTMTPGAVAGGNLNVDYRVSFTVLLGSGAQITRSGLILVAEV